MLDEKCNIGDIEYMKACWLKTPAIMPGQLLELTVSIDGVFFTGGFAVATRRMQDVVFGLEPTRIEGSPRQRFLGRVKKPTNKLHKRQELYLQHRRIFNGRNCIAQEKLLNTKKAKNEEQVYWRGYDKSGHTRECLLVFRERYNRKHPHCALLPEGGEELHTPYEVYVEDVRTQTPKWQWWTKGSKEILDRLMEKAS